MEKIEKTKDKLSFTVEIEDVLINAIRRYIGRIPIFAIDSLEISKNDSPLYDETLSHRTGLIPLNNKKSQKESSLKNLKLSVNKEGVVYSEELQGDLEVAFKKIPLTVLNKGQKLDFVAEISKGIGEDHSKFSPGLLYYMNMVDIKLDKSCSKEIVNVCPKKVFVDENNKIKIKSSECDMCGVCIDFCKKNKKTPPEISENGKKIVFIESFGQIDVEEIFTQSIKSLKKDFEELLKKI